MNRIKKILLSSFLGLCGVLLIQTLGHAQERGNNSPRPSPNASVSQTIGTTVVTITYGRPGIKGREIFGGLVPLGEVWRAGANESTAITFSGNVKIEGKDVAAGTYSLYTIPGKNEWTIIINKKLSWGTQYDSAEDLVRVTTTPEMGRSVEQFMIYFEQVTDKSAEAVLHWDTAKVPFTIEV